MEESGINVSRIILIIPTMELEDSSRDLERIYLGSQLLKPICNYMMNLLLRQAGKKKKSPSRFYCVETLCAPCGTVIAWAKFAKSESLINILNFLETVYLTEESCPACLVFCTAIVNRSWDAIWKNTTRFIVDTYHYINHHMTDYLCHKWCNPAPQDGSAPNIVIVSRDDHGQLYIKRAFNTQACEQLNAWLGGFESILKRMAPSNFDCFLHTMLFYHTRHVLEKHRQRNNNAENSDDIDEDDSEEEMD